MRNNDTNRLNKKGIKVFNGIFKYLVLIFAFMFVGVIGTNDKVEAAWYKNEFNSFKGLEFYDDKLHNNLNEYYDVLSLTSETGKFTYYAKTTEGCGWGVQKASVVQVMYFPESYVKSQDINNFAATTTNVYYQKKLSDIDHDYCFLK